MGVETANEPAAWVVELVTARAEAEEAQIRRRGQHVTERHTATDDEIRAALATPSAIDGRLRPRTLIELSMLIAGMLGLDYRDYIPDGRTYWTDAEQWGWVVDARKLRKSLDRLTESGELAARQGWGSAAPRTWCWFPAHLTPGELPEAVEGAIVAGDVASTSEQIEEWARSFADTAGVEFVPVVRAEIGPTTTVVRYLFERLHQFQAAAVALRFLDKEYVQEEDNALRMYLNAGGRIVLAVELPNDLFRVPLGGKRG